MPARRTWVRAKAVGRRKGRARRGRRMSMVVYVDDEGL